MRPPTRPLRVNHLGYYTSNARKTVEEGMKPIRRCGWEKVRAGLTTPEEVLRATLRDE